MTLLMYFGKTLVLKNIKLIILLYSEQLHITVNCIQIAVHTAPFVTNCLKLFAFLRGHFNLRLRFFFSNHSYFINYILQGNTPEIRI